MFRRYCRALGLTALAVGSLTLAVAQDPKPAVPADVIPAGFRAFVATDSRFPKLDGKDNPLNRVDKMHDLVTDNALNPVVAIFSRQPPMVPGQNNGPLVANPAISKLAVKMNELVTDKELKAARLGSFVMFLTLGKEYPEADNRDQATKDTKDLATQLKTLGVPFALAPGKSDAVTAWGIGEKDEVTVVFYREMKIVKKWTFIAGNLGDDAVKEIAAAVEKELRAKK